MLPSFIARHIPRQPQVIAFALVLPLASAFGWWWCRDRLALLAGFDAAALTYLIWIVSALSSATPKHLRSQVARYDSGQRTLLALAVLVFAVVLVAVREELGNKAQRTSAGLALIIGTLVVAWSFGNMIFALHYMHRHYGDGATATKGLGFTGDGDPRFWDFVYFAYTIGMTFQTSDVSLNTTELRRLATLHALLAFVFNVGVVALSVNLLAGA